MVAYQSDFFHDDFTLVHPDLDFAGLLLQGFESGNDLGVFENISLAMVESR